MEERGLWWGEMPQGQQKGEETNLGLLPSWPVCGKWNKKQLIQDGRNDTGTQERPVESGLSPLEQSGGEGILQGSC